MAITFPTQSDCVQEVIKQMSMVPGTSVQNYAEDIIASYVQSAFDEIFDSYFWPNYSSWQTYTLDGTLGIPNADISSTLKRYEDIGKMLIGGTDREVKKLPTDTNPFLITGSSPKFFAPYLTTPERIFQIYPNESTGTVVCRVRTHPGDFESSTSVKIDKWLVVYKAAWLYCEQDASNPGQTAVFQKRYEDRFIQVTGNIIGTGLVAFDPREGSTETEWH